MILVLGGTTEGRIAVETLEEAGSPFYYSTRGSEQDVSLHNGIRLQGGMDAVAMEAFCHEHDIRLMVDAGHPFAVELHRTAATVAQKLDIPAIRLERIYPNYEDYEGVSIIWCDDYDDAIRRVQADRVETLLCLTGVQTIGRLRALWRGETDPERLCRCYFRILDRPGSRALAQREGFPEQRLHYYRQGEDERTLMSNLHPQAILTKESGTSGGFCQKVDAALELGIRVYVVRRPQLPNTFHTVNGPHGLRRLVEHMLPSFYPLHSGLTTGTCATAAAVAATRCLLHALDDIPTSADTVALPSGTNAVTLPSGETIAVDIEALSPPTLTRGGDGQLTLSAQASVIKDAGDDPDITNGMRVCAHVRIAIHNLQEQEPIKAQPALNPSSAPPRSWPIEIQGGEGIGTVTMPGLGLPIGGPAINETPQRMIRYNVGRLLGQWKNLQGQCTITLSIPGGEEIAQRTFNPRIGVVGGISIIGTSGIVKPFSSEAFVNSIRKSMAVALATGTPRVVINSGAKSERYLRTYYPDLPMQAFVHYGNFIGETIGIAAELGVEQLTLGLMIGKAVKLAEGQMDTHSKHSTMNRAFLQTLTQEAGCSHETTQRIATIGLARELWTIIPPDELPAFCRVLTAHCYRHCAPLLPQGQLAIVLITEAGQVITS